MRLPAACCAVMMVLSGCASISSPQSNGGLDVDDGIGSQRGNYEMRPAGETHNAAGDLCHVFNWDRPLNKNFAIRYTSASCESKEHPVWMNTTPYTRKVIPISESNLKSGQRGP